MSSFRSTGIAHVLVLLHGTNLEKLVLMNCLLAWLGIPKHCVSFPQSCLGSVGWGIQLAALSLQMAWLKDKIIGFITSFFFWVITQELQSCFPKVGREGLNFLLGVRELRWDVNCDNYDSDGNCNSFLWVGAVSRCAAHSAWVFLWQLMQHKPQFLVCLLPAT